MLKKVAQFILRLLQICTIPVNCFKEYPQLIENLKSNNINLEQIDNSDEIFLKRNEPTKIFIIAMYFFYDIFKNNGCNPQNVKQEYPKIIKNKKFEEFFKLWIVYIQAQKHYLNKQKASHNTQLKDNSKVNTIVEEEFKLNFHESNEDIIKLLDYIYIAFFNEKIKREKQFQQDDDVMDFDNYWLDNQDIEQEDNEAYEDPLIIQESSISHDELSKQQYFDQWEPKQQ